MVWIKTENPNHKPGDEDNETGEKYTSTITFFKMFFMFILLVAVSQFLYNSTVETIKHFQGVQHLNYKTFWISFVIISLIFIILERFIIKKPFKSFY